MGWPQCTGEARLIFKDEMAWEIVFVTTNTLDELPPTFASICEHSLKQLRAELAAQGIKLPSDCHVVMQAVHKQEEIDYVKSTMAGGGR
jgi:hypothetical protein